MPLCELQSESRMRENRTSGLTSGDGRRSYGTGMKWPPAREATAAGSLRPPRPSSTLPSLRLQRRISLPLRDFSPSAVLDDLPGRLRGPRSRSHTSTTTYVVSREAS